jgi:hypothetical protein
MNHFTDKAGYDGIRAQVVWRFLAHQPPGIHPFGAYFTSLSRGTANLAKRLRIPKEKVEYVFEFMDGGDLLHLPGGRGKYVFYSPTDYDVDGSRQQYHGLA